MSAAWRAGAVAAGTTSCVISRPTGVVDGDVLLAFVASDVAVTAPAGWNTLVDVVSSARVFRRLVQNLASEPTSYTFTAAGGVIVEGIIDAFSGVDNGSPEDVAPTGSGGGSGDPVVWPDITPVSDDTLHWVVSANSPSAVAVPTGYTGRSLTATLSRSSTKAIATAGLITGVSASTGVTWVSASVVLRSFIAGTDTRPLQQNASGLRF